MLSTLNRLDHLLIFSRNAYRVGCMCVFISTWTPSYLDLYLHKVCVCGGEYPPCLRGSLNRKRKAKVFHMRRKSHLRIAWAGGEKN